MTPPAIKAEATLAAPADAVQQLYRLYVSSASPVSARAVVNARRFFERYLPGQHRLHVLDISTHVASAREDQVIASPTLIRMLPLPRRRFIGDMSDTERLRVSLGLSTPTAEE